MSKRIVEWLGFLFIFSIPFTTKKFLYPFAPGVSERTTIFLYGMDIGLLVLFLTFLWFRKSNKNITVPRGTGMLLTVLGVFLLFGLFSVVISSSPSLSFYTWARLVVALLSGIMVAYLLLSRALSALGVFIALALSAVFQSILGFLQFFTGRSVGLSFLGESVITPATTGVARIGVGGVNFLRAYGTMQHANILAGFLGLGLVALLFLWFSIPRNSPLAFKKEFILKLLVALGIFVVVFGLVLTFSRSGWIASALGILFFLAFTCAGKRVKRRDVLSLALTLFAAVVFIASVMWFAISPRVAASTVEDPSINYRLRYDIMGLQIIEHEPEGVGIGNQVGYSTALHSYQKLGITRPIDWQPIHNLYLLMASETGIGGLIIFLAFLSLLIVPRVRPALRDGETAAALALLALLLVFGLFDHFLWTLESGRLMLWVAIGLVFAAGVRTARVGE